MEQQQREREARDVTASQTEKRQALEARHADLVQRANAANAVQDMKPVNSELRKDALNSGTGG